MVRYRLAYSVAASTHHPVATLSAASAAAAVSPAADAAISAIVQAGGEQGEGVALLVALEALKPRIDFNPQGMDARRPIELP